MHICDDQAIIKISVWLYFYELNYKQYFALFYLLTIIAQHHLYSPFIWRFKCHNYYFINILSSIISLQPTTSVTDWIALQRSIKVFFKNNSKSYKVVSFNNNYNNYVYELCEFWLYYDYMNSLKMFFFYFLLTKAIFYVGLVYFWSGYLARIQWP